METSLTQIASGDKNQILTQSGQMIKFHVSYLAMVQQNLKSKANSFLIITQTRRAETTPLLNDEWVKKSRKNIPGTK